MEYLLEKKNGHQKTFFKKSTIIQTRYEVSLRRQETPALVPTLFHKDKGEFH